MYLTIADSGGRRVVRVGTDVTVSLPENPSTGYRWYVDSDDVALRQTGDEYTGPPVPAGAGGIRRITFEAVRAGSVRLRLVKRRPWEEAAAEEFEVRLEIEPP